MAPEQVFSIANLVAMGGWILLAALPKHKWIADTVAGIVIPAIFAALYTVLIAVHFWSSEGGFSTLGDVRLLFSNPWLLVAGWIHYLAFDMLIGSWEVRDARDRGVPHLFVVPCLVLTFLFGPAGWLAYLGVRGFGGVRKSS